MSHPNEGELFKMLAQGVQEHLKASIDEQKVREIVADAVSSRLPRVVEVRRPDGSVKLEGGVHAQFDDVIGLVNEGHRNILMVGPAGSGKTSLARSLAKALELPFGFISLSAGVSETHLLGRMLPAADGSWQYQPSQFVSIYEQGGVFLLDEVDAADANVMVAINAALANGVLANPNGRTHVRHERTIVVAAANTWGRGGDTQYVGRNQLDAATLDRFVLSSVHVQYDTKLESMIAEAVLPNDQAEQLVRWVHSVRDQIARNKLRRIASTRLVANAASAMKAGRTLDDVKSRYFMDWSDDEKAKVSNV